MIHHNILDFLSHPASTVLGLSKTDDDPENILAFKCITALLENLPQERPVEVKKDAAWRQCFETQDELKITGAFARLAVSQHQSVAVSIHRGRDLNLLICATQDAAETCEHTDYLHFLTNRNDRSASSSAFSRTLKPTIVTAMEPDDLHGQTIYDYMTKLEHNWVKPTLSTHLWILSQVYMESANYRNEGSPTRSDFTSRLFWYTAAVSYEKMKRRLTHSTLSRPFIDSLRKVTNVPIPSLSRWISRRTTGNAQDDKEETANDYLFLRDCVKVFENGAEFVDTPMPNLLKLANELPPHSSLTSSFTIYDDNTCTEFHQLLLLLLARFETALECLSTLDLEKPKDYSIQFMCSVLDVQVYGYSLLRLSKGRAFRVHIQNINYMLGPGTHREESVEKDPDEELEAMQPNDCVGWLQLVVSHFADLETVLSFVTSNRFLHSSIAVKILLAPSTSGTLYPWRELLTHPKYFPTEETDYSKSMFAPRVSNKELLDFIDKGISEASRAKEFSAWATTVRDEWNNRTSGSFNYQQLCQAVKKLVDSDDLMVAIKNTADKIHTTLQEWYSKDKPELADSQESAITIGVNSVYKELHSFAPGHTFFRDLENLQFKGTMHCEACLASFHIDSLGEQQQVQLNDYDIVQISSEVQGYGRTIGLSKHCCPICVRYLFELKILSGGEPFAIQSTSSFISACTLPTWSPSEVVDRMVQIFGAELRRNLVALLQNTKGFNMKRQEEQMATRRYMARQGKQRQDSYDWDDDWFW